MVFFKKELYNFFYSASIDIIANSLRSAKFKFFEKISEKIREETSKSLEKEKRKFIYKLLQTLKTTKIPEFEKIGHILLQKKIHFKIVLCCWDYKDSEGEFIPPDTIRVNIAPVLSYITSDFTNELEKYVKEREEYYTRKLDALFKTFEERFSMRNIIKVLKEKRKSLDQIERIRDEELFTLTKESLRIIVDFLSNILENIPIILDKAIENTRSKANTILAIATKFVIRDYPRVLSHECEHLIEDKELSFKKKFKSLVIRKISEEGIASLVEYFYMIISCYPHKDLKDIKTFDYFWKIKRSYYSNIFKELKKLLMDLNEVKVSDLYTIHRELEQIEDDLYYVFGCYIFWEAWRKNKIRELINAKNDFEFLNKARDILKDNKLAKNILNRIEEITTVLHDSCKTVA